MGTYTKIGVWQTAFLGDAVLTLPLLRALARAYPAAEIQLWVRDGFASLFAPQPELAAVHNFAKRGRQKSLAAALGLGRELSRQGFDLWISPHASLRSGLVAWASRVPTRIGYSRPALNRLLYTRTVDRGFDRLEEIERLLELLRPLGLDPAAADPWPRLALDPAAADRAAEFLQRSDGPVVGVHPGSVWPTKRWPEEHFARLVGLAVGAGARVALFGAPGPEAELAGRIARAAGPSDRVHDLAGKLSLPDLAAHLGRLDAYVTNDSGPMHLAWVQHTPVVALFGPTVRRLGFFPRGPRSRVLELDLACRPCGLHGGATCPEGHHRCLRKITPDTVWGEVRAALEAGREPGPEEPR